MWMKKEVGRDTFVPEMWVNHSSSDLTLESESNGNAKWIHNMQEIVVGRSFNTVVEWTETSSGVCPENANTAKN